MTNEEIEIKELIARLSYWILQIRMTNGIFLFDGNKLAEPLVLKLLNLLYDLNLKDLNEEKANAPGIDLSDKKAGVAFQVSSRTDANKVISTLRKANDHNFASDYPNGIRFFVLNDGGKFEFKKIKPTDIIPGFDEKRDIIYLEDISKRIKSIYETDEIKFRQLKDLLQKEIRYPEPDQSSLKADMTNLLLLVQSHFEKEAEKSPIQPLSFDETFEVDLSLPSLSLASRREATVKIFLASYETQPMLWLSGSIGTGKTGLAYLLATHFEPNAFWIDLRDQETSIIVSKIVALLCSNFNLPRQKNWKTTVEHLASQFPKDSILVINDLPSLAGMEKVRQQLEHLLQTLLKAGVRLLITSNYTPYSELTEIFSNQLLPTVIPPFSEAETAEVLHFYGATDEFINDHGNMITTMTDGHALLIHTAARYLAEHRWDMTDDVFMDIFKSNFGQEYTGEVYARILDSTQDEESKMLLYRMAIIMGTFTDREIAVIGNVSPEIAQTNERSQGLKGTWLQESEKGHFQLSPLIKKLNNNLPQDLHNHINEALGDMIVAKKRLSQIDAGDILVYYLRAQAYIKLSWMLLRVLEASVKNPSLFFDWGFQLYWYRTPLPSEIPSFLKAMIRSFHLQLSEGRQEDIDFLVSDLERILQTEDVGLIAKGFAELMISHVYLKKDPVKSLRYFLLARADLKSLDEQLQMPDRDLLFSEDLLWTSFYSLRTQMEFEEWFRLFNTVQDELDITKLDQSEPYVLAAHSLVHVTVLKENENPQQALDTLQTVYRLALEANFKLIAVYAIRYSISVQGIYQKNLLAAKQYILDNEQLVQSLPIYNYLVKEEYGRQLYYAGQKDEALAILSEVINVDIFKPFLEGVEGYRIYAQLISQKDDKAAHYFIEKALDKILNDPSHSEIERIKILGEAGISSWLVGRKSEAMYRLAEAYQRLIKIFNETEEHQAIIIRLAHVANYIRGEIIQGKAPEKTADGGDYAVPVRGLFYFDYTALLASGFYFEERKFMGAMIFEEVFEFFNDYQAARNWALLGIEISLSLSSTKYFAVLYKTLGYLITERQYTKAINLYRNVESLFDKIRKEIKEGKDVGEFENIKHFITSGENDAFFYQQVMIPITLTIAHDIITKKLPTEKYGEVIENLFNAIAPAVRDQDSLRFAYKLFRTLLVEGVSDAKLDSLLSTYSGPYVSQMRTMAHLLQSIPSDALNAARLQLAIAFELNFFQKLLPSFYRFELIPFLEAFWLQKFEQYPRQVNSLSFWKATSLPYFRKAPLEHKLRKLFEVVVHHLEVQLAPSLEEWLYK